MKAPRACVAAGHEQHVARLPGECGQAEALPEQPAAKAGVELRHHPLVEPRGLGQAREVRAPAPHHDALDALLGRVCDGEHVREVGHRTAGSEVRGVDSDAQTPAPIATGLPLRADSSIANVARVVAAISSHATGEGSPAASAAITSRTAARWPLSWF